MQTTQGSITVYHTLPAFVNARARQLGLTRAAYLSLLLSNYLYGPSRGLPHLEMRGGKIKRQPIQVTLPTALRRAGSKAADHWKLSFSRLLESLIALDVLDAEDTFLIHPVAGRVKPPCKLPA